MEIELINKRDNLKNKLIFHLSQIGFALNCDFIFYGRENIFTPNIENLQKLENGSKIFIGDINLDYNRIKSIFLQKNIKVIFYITGEPIIEYSIIETLLPVALSIYVNNNIYENPIIHNLPIGIRDCENILPVHCKDFNHLYLLNEGSKNIKKDILCLLCFSIHTFMYH
jgi:hypothetical protein